VNKNKIYHALRNEFMHFTFEDFKIKITSEKLAIKFYFNLSDRYHFTPIIEIPKKNFLNFNINDNDLRNLAFHIGMVELVSYWKAACPQKVIIKPFKLSEDQLNWWKKLYFNGLGEFFYVNQIDCDFNTFMQISSGEGRNLSKFNFSTSGEYIVPIGGGKDSIVTLETLLQNQKQIKPLILNPRQANMETVGMAGFGKDDVITINRTIHPQLLELNKKGFLNGHTPFSALLAFVSLLAARLSGIRNIALSNESSANEVTVPGSHINHQYSKSIEFEQDFREYVRSYISDDYDYFSLLRPLSELQIGKIFAMNNKYFSVFKSCNVGSKTDSWCGKCPKCLFTWIILSPFLEEHTLVGIFGGNLLNDTGLIKVFKQLIGEEAVKPFECVGTVDEINLALSSVVDKYAKNHLPGLLKYYSALPRYRRDNGNILEDKFGEFDDTHFVSPELIDYIKKALK